MYFNQQNRARIIGLAICLALGFAANAQDTRQSLSDAEIRALGEDQHGGEFYRLILDPKSANADQTMPKGGAGTFYTAIAASEFRPRSSHASFNVPNHAALSCQVDSTTALAEAQVQFPQGATLQFLRIYANDSSDQDLNVALVERCQPVASAGNVTSTVLASVLTANTPGRLTQSIAFPAATTVDNTLCIYSLRAQLGSTLNGCAAGLFLDKARIQWIE
jgi:hypothetical protein